MSYTRDQIIEAELRRLVKDVEAYLEWHQKEGPFPILECDLKYSHLALDSSPRNATPIPPARPEKAQRCCDNCTHQNSRPTSAVRSVCSCCDDVLSMFTPKLAAESQQMASEVAQPNAVYKHCETEEVRSYAATSPANYRAPKPAVAQEKPREDV